MPIKKKSTTKTSVIMAEDGKRLRLTPTRLIQIDHASYHPWYVTEPDLRTAVRTNSYYIPIHQVCSGNMEPYRLIAIFNAQAQSPRIGCCIFEDAVFRRILRYYGIRKSRSKARA